MKRESTGRGSGDQYYGKRAEHIQKSPSGSSAGSRRDKQRRVGRQRGWLGAQPTGGETWLSVLSAPVRKRLSARKRHTQRCRWR